MLSLVLLASFGAPKPCPHLHLPDVRPGITLRSSLSRGKHGDGRLLAPAQVPLSGEALAIMPGEHRNRRRNYSSTELANALLSAAGELRADFPEVTTYIGDISGVRGGPISGHSSHEIGLDVDLAFFYRDATGKLVAPTFMWHVGPDGISTTDAPEPLTFDADLTWAFLEKLLRSAQIELQWAFVSAPVEAKILEAGRRAQAPEELLRRAETILHQLTRGAPHDDHLHLRAYCPPSDWEFCVDTGPVWDWVVQPPPPRPETMPLAQR